MAAKIEEVRGRGTGSVSATARIDGSHSRAEHTKICGYSFT